MKRLFFVTLSLVYALLVTAAPRTQQEAQQLAAQYFTAHAHSLRAPQHGQVLQYAWTGAQPDGVPAYYVFNRGEEDGFIIISADDKTASVLAYSDAGHFSEADIPDNARMWLTAYSHQIHQAAQLWEEENRAPSAVKTYTPVAPICQTKWNQGHPYNQYCPSKSGQRTLTGCVATAAAQIMKVHNHPATGVGSHSYFWHRGNNDSVLLSVDFSSTTYNWSVMTNTCTSASPQDTRVAIGTLMYHCGVASNMVYGLSATGGSWALFDDMMYGLVDHFDYDQGIRIILKDYLGEAAFLDSLHTELQSGRPIYMSGRTKQDEGHAFICDGMDANGLVHINWGWGGNCDAFYQISLLDPANQGAGGSASNAAYVVRVCAYTHIQPNTNGNTRHTLVAQKAVVEKERFARNATPSIKIDTMMNLSLYRWEGNRGLLLYKDGQFFKACLDNSSGALNPYYYYSYVRVRPSLADVPVGEYEVVPVMTVTNQPGVYEPIYLWGQGICRCRMQVTADSIFIGQNYVPEPQAVENVLDSSKPQGVKRLQHGQLFIERGEDTYTVTGQKVK